MIIARPYPTQPTPPNQHTLFEKDDLTPRMGSLLLRTSCLLTPCYTHSSSALQKSGILNHMVFATDSGRTKPCIRIPTLR